MIKNNYQHFLEQCQSCNEARVMNLITLEVAESSDPYLICDYAENVKAADTVENITELENAMIKTGDLVHMYEFMFLMVDSEINNFNLKRFEEIIKKSNNPKLMCYCIGFVPGIDFDSMLEALYETKNVKYIERLSSEEFEIDIDTLPGYQEKLERARKYDYFPDCLSQFNTKDVNILMTKAIQSKSPYLINEMADYIEYLRDYKSITEYNIEPLQQAQLKYADPLHLYEFAASIADSDKEAFQNAVIDRGIPKYMYYVYEYVSGVNKEELEKSIKETGNVKYINKIARTK